MKFMKSLILFVTGLQAQVIFTDQADSVDRRLYATYNDPITMGNNCKKLCVDKGKNFCANSAFTGGYCCDADEKCPRADLCSLDNPKAPLIFKYLACPSEPACVSKMINPDYNTKFTRTIDKWSQNFVDGDVCGYVITAPPQMKEADILYLKISQIENADVYVAKGKAYIWLDHLDQMVTGKGSTLDTRMGWQFYVVVVANSVFRGTITMEVWVEKNAAPPLIPPPAPTPVNPPTNVVV